MLDFDGHTAYVRDEVNTAHMQLVQTQLAAIGSVLDAAPTPRYLELRGRWRAGGLPVGCAAASDTLAVR